MAPIATDDATDGERELASEMQVTFDTDELASFFDGFSPLDLGLELLDEEH